MRAIYAEPRAFPAIDQSEHLFKNDARNHNRENRVSQRYYLFQIHPLARRLRTRHAGAQFDSGCWQRSTHRANQVIPAEGNDCSGDVKINRLGINEHNRAAGQIADREKHRCCFTLHGLSRRDENGDWDSGDCACGRLPRHGQYRRDDHRVDVE
ncbi:hypothetical protein [Paraburkholderia sp.]|uniref:hypothetical protein n=1 Tax=Paraburkholderia sp. TaxID=1926495 RepID=UPI00286FA942|nr:hypothetical protein [Paraburkholderia sp.]